MKKLLLLMTCAVTISFTAHSQNVANSYWLGYDQANNPDLYWHFGTDTLSFTTTLPSWLAVSTFTETVSQVSITDIPDTSQGFCGSTGTYNKVFNGDTMWLNLVNDPCTSRVSYISTHYFISQPLGIAHAEAQPEIVITPNPTSGIFTVTGIETADRIVITDLSGRIVIEQEANESSATISLENFPSGVYFVTTLFENGTSFTQRMMKQ